MNSEFIETLMNLCREIHLVLDLDPEEFIEYESRDLEQELYIFYTDISQDPSSIDTVQLRCDQLRNNFTLFILSLKQQTSESPYQKQAINETLILISEKLISFIKSIAIGAEEDSLLLDLDNLIMHVTKTSPSTSLASFITGNILKEKSYIEGLMADLISLKDTEIKNRVKSIVIQCINFFEECISEVMKSNLHGILEVCKETSKEVGYILASIMSLDDPPIPEELDDLISSIELLERNLLTFTLKNLQLT